MPQTTDTSLPAVDTSLRFVRVIERRADGLVAFEFSIGWPELAVELMLPAPAFEGSALAARLKVELEWKRNRFQTKTDTEVHVVNFSGTCVKNTPKPSVTFASDCTGVVTVTLINGEGATKNAVFTIKGAGDWTSEPVEVTPGNTAVVTVPESSTRAERPEGDASGPLVNRLDLLCVARC